MGALAAVGAFLASAVGRYALIAVVAGGLLIGTRQQGYNAAQRKCEAAAAQRQIEINQRDVKIAELLEREDQRIGAEQSRAQEIDDAAQRKLEAELAKRKPGDRCLLTKPNAHRLR
jgi:hypothetical protein